MDENFNKFIEETKKALENQTKDIADRLVDKVGEFAQLPNTVVWGFDAKGNMMSEIREQMNLTSPSLPVFLICDSFNRVVSVHQGYTINLGEQLLKVIRKL